MAFDFPFQNSGFLVYNPFSFPLDIFLTPSPSRLGVPSVVKG